MDDSIHDFSEASRSGKFTGLALRPYSALPLCANEQTGASVLARKGLAPIDVVNQIAGIVNISGKVFHDTKKRGDMAALPAVSSRHTRLNETDSFNDSLPTLQLNGRNAVPNHARPSSSPLHTFQPPTTSSTITQNDSLHGFMPSPTYLDMPMPSSAYLSYNETLSQKLEKEFKFIPHPKSRQTSPHRKIGASAMQKLGVFSSPDP